MPSSATRRTWLRIQAVYKSFPENVRLIVSTSCLATLAALGAIAFMEAIHFIFDEIYLNKTIQSNPLHFAIGSFIAITAAALISGWLLFAYCPQASGSGVPQVKAGFWKELGFIRFREVWVKFIGGIIGIAGGMSLGREGPSVFVGGGLASCTAGALGTNRRARRPALIIGSAAALAAAFNTPMAAVAFALEEVIKDFGSRLVGRVMLAAVLGALAVHALVGPQPSFLLPKINEPRWTVYPLAILAAILGALMGVIFQKGVMKLRPRFKQQKKLPNWLMPCMGAWVTWFLGVGVFLLSGKVGVFGLGYGDMSNAMQTDIALWIAALLLVTKLIATIACYATGGCGGIFSPSLFFGAMAGFVIGGIFQNWMGLQHDEKILLAAVGMCSCFGAVVHAPWSALLIVFEMTHSFSIIPALIIGSLVGQGVTHLLARINFYDEILEQDGHILHTVAPPRTLNDWQDLPLVTIASKRPVVITDWSAESLSAMLIQHPYNMFPARTEDGLRCVSRVELEAAVKENRQPSTEQVGIARPEQVVREISDIFIQTRSGMILIIDPETDQVTGLLTLHDILRAQAALME